MYVYVCIYMNCYVFDQADDLSPSIGPFGDYNEDSFTGDFLSLIFSLSVYPFLFQYNKVL